MRSVERWIIQHVVYKVVQHAYDPTVKFVAIFYIPVYPIQVGWTFENKRKQQNLISCEHLSSLLW